MPLNKDIVGKSYTAEPTEVTAHGSIFYALAYNEDNDAYFDGRREGGIIAPPMYAVYYAGRPIVNIMNDPETGMNMQKVVHWSQEYEWLRPVRPGDVIRTEAVITHVTVRRFGGLLGWETVSRNQRDEEVVKTKWEFFDLSAGDRSVSDPRERPQRPAEFLWERTMTVRNGQTFIYAEASGDNNPIHLDDAAAKGVGLDGVILQGLCTMAFAHKAVVDTCAGPERDPLRVRKLKVQFARAVLPGQTLTFKGFRMEDAEGKIGLLARNDAGKDVLMNAWCEVV
ncbi:MAG TPA: MaoC/PaaZ C-terminal domain-containing protein [Spirochaetota bacterium]|nr:MaoC/PaaZ C-terminal domain-containing protein [Spirochaetota bacterium]HPI22242.1 MaoC/PaaZ C-terminal domain-containing protein [Spirochaetota bacterium]HPU88465.1 MaoC/PaaZ C-terminal domain-containing protein [Spirochaetota bacterium]